MSPVNLGGDANMQEALQQATKQVLPQQYVVSGDAHKRENVQYTVGAALDMTGRLIRAAPIFDGDQVTPVLAAKIENVKDILAKEGVEKARAALEGPTDQLQKFSANGMYKDEYTFIAAVADTLKSDKAGVDTPLNTAVSQ
mmetsp:Transcript_10010/g.11666  ORF Transcript_10010/g.11666 Transcript_10010/m.11666 type:complete len:141 (-) Transcript_10010:865-1287(-)|eukprot:CAMPEP_0197861198 /NCGR_PEP_ID=MMETSP1438-20131217/37090_1 /TAXON_ID=1461541 /ORGANISM="Pterosperma sp., Strain CCMP1384" /LENGTH=140 /DNA_ID=CAMNT_0043478295 /DNA_START=108 /DNA_END=530 /DNA_ORIENTATION=+